MTAQIVQQAGSKPAMSSSQVMELVFLLLFCAFFVPFLLGMIKAISGIKRRLGIDDDLVTNRKPAENSPEYLQGFEAYAAGRDANNIPYPEGSPEREEWVRGYWFAATAEQVHESARENG
jgi:hypothetical protein